MQYTLAIFVITTVASAFVSAVQLQTEYNTCTTPNGEAAQCISIYSCAILYNAVTTRNTQQLNFLRESQCGYDQEPLVCCGSDDNYKRKPQVRPQTGGKRKPGGTGGRRPTNNKGSNKLIPDRSTCGLQSDNRILDGQVTGLDEFPWMALLQYRRTSGGLTFSCGGTLISPRYVLTAAHCVTGKILTKVGTLVTVRLGEWNTDTDEDCVQQYGYEMCSDPPVDVGVEEAIPHPDYKDGSTNRYDDIALVRLKREVPITQFVTPICLPLETDNSRVDTRLTVAGWGKTEYSNSSPVKLKLKVPVKSPSSCANRFRTAGVNIGETQLCAGAERNRDSCNGDSGGPLMSTTGNKTAQFYIEGIVSFGAKCGSEGWPGIYTRVSKYLDWIQENVRA